MKKIVTQHRRLMTADDEIMYHKRYITLGQKQHRPPPEVGQNIPIKMTKNSYCVIDFSIEKSGDFVDLSIGFLLLKMYSFFNDLGGGCPYKCP